MSKKVSPRDAILHSADPILSFFPRKNQSTSNHYCNDEFTFIVNGRPVRNSLLAAIFLCPAVEVLLSRDSSAREYHITGDYFDPRHFLLLQHFIGRKHFDGLSIETLDLSSDSLKVIDEGWLFDSLLSSADSVILLILEMLGKISRRVFLYT
jgi:hypothetical protein